MPTLERQAASPGRQPNGCRLHNDLTYVDIAALLLWQSKCSGRVAVNIRIKSKIRFNGQEYSSPRELPAEARAAYEKAMRAPAIVTSHRIIINDQEFAGETDLPADQKRIYDDVLALIQDNGEVTLPQAGRTEPWLTAGQTKLVLFLAGLLVLAALAILSR